MGHRITWRSRPKSEYPWPLRTLDVLAADIETEWAARAPGLLGPLPMKAVVEWLYRVSNVTLRVTGTDPGTLGSVDESIALYAIRDNLGSTDPMDELGAFEVFNQDAFDIYAAVPTNIGSFAGSVLFDGGGAQIYPLLSASSIGRPVDWEPYPILRDDNGLFWVSSRSVYIATDGDGDTVESNWYGDSTGLPNRVTGSLVLASGTYPVEARSSASDGTFIITATGWFPYAYPNGSPNWNRFDGSYLPEQTPDTTSILPLL